MFATPSLAALTTLLICLTFATPNVLAAEPDDGRMSLRERLKARREARANPPPSAPTVIQTPGDYTYTLRHQGLVREYRVHVPNSYTGDAAQPVPLVMAFHGGGGNMDIQANDRYYGLITRSEQSGTVLVFPNGYSRLRSGKLATWNAGICCGKARDDNVDDVGFVRAVLADVQSRLIIDQTRIFATGMSNGGMFSYRLACEMADTFRAIASVAGTDGTGPSCRPSQPIAVLHIHALDDDRVLFNGGSGSASSSHADFVSVPATIAKWTGLNHCSAQSQTVLEVPGALCEVHAACKDGAQVKLCVTDTGGHAWPGGTQPHRGKAGSTALSANQVIWEFFGIR